MTDHADGCYSWGPQHYECARRRIAELAGEMAENLREIERLQVALAFWLPHVPAVGPEDIAQRLGDDALLLRGLNAAMGLSAEELGWVRLALKGEKNEK